MTDGWVLDIRHRGVNSPDGLRLTNATAYGELRGYSLGAQRRSQDGNSGLSMRITAPDGRSLDLVGFHNNATNAKSPVSGALSGAISLIFSNPKDADADRCVERLDAVLSAGLECLSLSISGQSAADRVQCAAEGIDYAVLMEWQARLGRGYSRDLATAREVSSLSSFGFTPETTPLWFDQPRLTRIPPVRHIETLARFRDHGWSPEDVLHVQTQAVRLANREPGQESLTFGGAHDPDAKATDLSRAWAPIGPSNAALAIRAGLAPREAARLLRTQEWDSAALEAIAALLV